MKKQIKRCISIFLLLILIFGGNSMKGICAAGLQKVTFEVGTATAAPGEANVQIPIELKNNPGIAGIKLRIAFDTTRVALEKVQFNDAWSGDFMPPQTMKSPASLTWYNGEANETAVNSTFVTLTFRVLDDAKPGDAPLTVSYDPNNIYNIAGQNLDVTIINGKITVPGNEPPAEQTVFEVGTATAAPGETNVQIPIELKNNPGIAGIKLRIAFDMTRVALEKIQFNEAWSGDFMPPQTMKSPAALTWYNGGADETAVNSTFVTLTFRVLDDAKPGDVPLTVTYDPNNIYNIANQNLNVSIKEGKIEIREKPVLEITSANKNAVTFTIDPTFLDKQENSFAGKGIVALYDCEGRMVSCEMKEIGKHTETLTVVFRKSNESAKTGGILFTSPESQPLCDKATFSIP